MNGSGKTTLLRILTGALHPDRGEVRFGRGARITMLEQDPVLPPGTVAEYLGDGWEVAAVATSLGVLPLFDRPTAELSGGQAKRVALAKMLADNGDGTGAAENGHDMIVLDEPTNHLDLEAIEWLESRLVSMSAALVLVTHDRHALDRLTTRVGPSKVVELDHGRCFIHQAAAGSSAYATYLDARAEREEREVQEESTRKILARKELAWLRRGAPARTSKPKARLRTASEIVSGGPRDLGVRANDLELGAGTTRLGNQVVELVDVGQRFPVADGGEATTVFTGVDLVIEPGARLAVVGPNGSGKTTLLDIIAGRRAPAMDRSRRARRSSSDTRISTRRPSIPTSRCASWWPVRCASPTTRTRRCSRSSGSTPPRSRAGPHALGWGEAAPAAGHGARTKAEPADPRRADQRPRPRHAPLPRGLPRRLARRAVLASHDRAFLDRVADHVLAIEPGGTMRRVPGGVSGWLAERAAAPGRTASSGRNAAVTDRTAPRGKPKTARPGRARRPSADGSARPSRRW